MTNLISELNCPACLIDGLSVTLTGVHKGSSSEILLSCPVCNWSNSVYSSPTIHESGNHELNRSYEINSRLALFTQEIGLGHASLQALSNTIGIPIMHQKTYRKHDARVSSSFIRQADGCLVQSRQAVRHAYLETDPLRDPDETLDIMVSFDGTWQKRGFTSLYGVGVVIDIMTGLIVDYHLLSKYCHACAQNKSVMSDHDFHVWKATHDDCCQNHEESSKKMEQVAAEVMWQRSVEFGFRYTQMLADGDSQAFNAVNGMVYEVEKLDCINHAHKRMGTALRNVRKTDKAVGGRGSGKLTDNKCLQLQNYYRGAIISNLTKGQDAMRDSIWATFFHSISTDDEPHHFRCPAGEDSWCFWQRALANGEEPPSHEDHVSSTFLCHDVAKKLIPVYQRFSSEPLLKRMMHGGTQNQNECFNSMIWARCPKTMFFGKNVLILLCHLPSCVSMKATWVYCVWWMICGCLQLCQSLIIFLGRMKWGAAKLMRQPQSMLNITGSSTPWASAVTCLPKQPGKEMMCMAQGSRGFSSYIIWYFLVFNSNALAVIPIEMP